jgi:transposase
MTPQHLPTANIKIYTLAPFYTLKSNTTRLHKKRQCVNVRLLPQLTLLKILPPKKADLNPIEIQLKSMVKASEIAHHKPQHRTINIGQIRSNQVTNPSTISRRVR